MNTYRIVRSKYFVVTGISHHDAEVAVREQFSINESSAASLMNEYMENGGEAILVLSTCNRTEIYALTDHPDEIADLLIKYSQASKEDYYRYCYVHKNELAFRHMFQVAMGMESQILGDFQIIGQLKNAFRLSKRSGASNAFLERLINTISQASKQVKNETQFSTGPASTSYAAVNYIKQSIPDYSNKKILLYGTGKIGRQVCENLIKHTSREMITVVNRSEEAASLLVKKHDIAAGKHENLTSHINQSDIIIVSTGATNPTVVPDMIFGPDKKYFIDLSVPRNVSRELEDMPNMVVADLDALSQIADETLDRRKEQIDNVQAIIEEHIAEFREWLQSRKYVPTIAAIKKQLEKIQSAEINKFKKQNGDVNEEHLHHVSSDIIRKLTNQLSSQLKSIPAENIELVHHLFRIDSSQL